MPTYMTVAEMMAAGMSREQAEQEMARRVFGHDHRIDRHGKPIEQGIGSLGHESEHHFIALERASGKEAADIARAKSAAKKGT